MHRADVVATALRLSADGLPGTAIAQALGIPRATVAGWLAGKVPHSFGSVAGPREVCARCGGEPHDFEHLPKEYVYLLGLYLGDGCISAGPRSVFRVRIALDRRYPGIVEECEAALRSVMPKNRVGRRLAPDNCYEVSSYSKAWPCLLPQHGPGKKHTRAIALTGWQEDHVATSPGLLLRGLIHSDGSRFCAEGHGRGAPRYNFRNRSGDIREIFCDACDLLGVRWTSSANDTIYVSRKADVAVLDRWVGPKR